MAKWHFNELTPRDKTREAMQGEFFATEAIRNPAEALVREAIQNSLDAGTRDGAGLPIETVRVRIHLGNGNNTANRNDCSQFFEGAWPHLQAEGNGLRTPPRITEDCTFLVFEDFGTSGLIGSISQWADEPGVKNSFYYFFRAEGRTGKSDEDRGRWGVGKYVFPRSSRANLFFGLTVRKDDNKRFLMGQAVLRSHKCDGKHYKPDGSYCLLGQDGLQLPMDDKVLVDRFCSVFAVSRKDEPGLSIVVPWIEPKEFTFAMLLEAVIRGYFYPILEGKLGVTLSDSSKEIVIDAENLVDAVKSLSNATADEILPLLDLAEWASTRKPSEMLKLNMAPDKPTWSFDLIPPDIVPVLQSMLDRGERIGIRIPLKIRAHDREDQDSQFDVFMVRDGTSADRTMFVREGIIISDVRARRARGIRSLVVADDRALATLLGDSENPAHTEWQSKSSNFHGKYKNGKSYLDFVIHCVSALDNILGSHQREEDTTLLKDFFSLPAPPSPDTAKTREKRRMKPKGPDNPSPEPTPEPRRKRYRLERVAGGFRLCTGDPDADVPKLIEIRAAYDVRRGNALQKYDSADFDFGSSDFLLEPRPEGVEILERRDNRMLVKIMTKDFILTVIGFDTKRDVLVNINVKEVEDAA
jgi:hypothetical protein